MRSSTVLMVAIVVAFFLVTGRLMRCFAVEATELLFDLLHLLLSVVCLTACVSQSHWTESKEEHTEALTRSNRQRLRRRLRLRLPKSRDDRVTRSLANKAQVERRKRLLRKRKAKTDVITADTADWEVKCME